MSSFRFFLVSILFTTSLISQNLANTPELFLGFEDDIYKELSLNEWKKFKIFEQKLGTITNDGQRARLKGFSRDSIQILGVKLMAIKLLDEKQLLDKDIADNEKYYAELLEELRESAIPQVEYLFLEEKMAFFNQATIENELSLSRWLNLVLLLVAITTAYWAFTFKKRIKALPELSRQEITVRNLILEGKSNKEIANELFISLSTVKSHITNLYSKLNVANRQELFQKSTGTST